jgi:hypothetical protein
LTCGSSIYFLVTVLKMIAIVWSYNYKQI